MDTTTISGFTTLANGTFSQTNIDTADLVVIAVYFAMVLAVGIWVRFIGYFNTHTICVEIVIGKTPARKIFDIASKAVFKQ